MGLRAQIHSARDLATGWLPPKKKAMNHSALTSLSVATPLVIVLAGICPAIRAQDVEPWCQDPRNGRMTDEFAWRAIPHASSAARGDVVGVDFVLAVPSFDATVSSTDTVVCFDSEILELAS